MAKKKFSRATKSKQEQLPLAELQVTMEAKRMFALAIEGIGGLQALIDWAKLNGTNKGMLIAHYAKMIPMSVMSDVNATVTVENEEQTKTALTDMIMNVIEARRGMLLAAMERGETLVEAPPFDPDAPLNIHTIAEQMLGLAIDNTVTTVDGVTTVDAVANPPEAEPELTSQQWADVLRFFDIDISGPITSQQIADLESFIDEPPATADTNPASPAAATTKPRPDIVNLSRQPPPVAPVPQPVSEPSTTQKYLEWANDGGGGGRMSRKDWGSI